MTIRVTKEGARWVARFPWSMEAKDAVKSAGFRFDGTTKLWWTTDPVIAGRLDPNAAEVANRAIEASRAVSAAATVPAPEGLSYLPYQLAGIHYALSKPSVLFGDEMGLGKTIEAVGVINADPSITSVLVVCPLTAVVNWARELTKWLVRPMSVGIATTGNFPKTDIVITHYDILAKLRPTIDQRAFDMLVADEVHKAKNPKAQRTIALLGKRDRKNPENSQPGIKARRRLFLSGTPIVNRPIELWPLVEALDPHGLGGNFMSFAKRYAAANNTGYGGYWDFKGASNLEELQTRLRAKFMVRRLKSEVLQELPERRRQVVVVPANGAAATVAEEWRAFQAHKEARERLEKAAAEAKRAGDKDGYRAAVKALHAADKVAFEAMSRLRHAVGVAKVPAVIEHLTDVLDHEDKVVCFVWHHDVADAIQKAFPTAAVITGQTKPGDRMPEVDRFQNDPECRVFVGSIGAAGEVITLTAAQTCVFAEEDWVPTSLDQCESRLHRIGQKGSVLAQHLVFDRSVDAYMAQVNVGKQDVIDAALNARGLPLVSAAPAAEELPLLKPQRLNGSGNGNGIPDDASCPF